MTGRALLLAAHGSRSDGVANALVRQHARRVEAMTGFDQVAVAFHHGTPSFATALDALEAADVTVVPLMTSDGYFSRVVLPRELRRNHCYPRIRVRQTRPIGTSPGITSLLLRRVAALVRRFRLEPDDTTIVLVGHGTERHGRSGSATLALAAALSDPTTRTQVLCAFLDQPPYVQDVFSRVAKRHRLVIPFLMGGGDHANRDIPARLGLTVGPGANPPFVGRVRQRTVVCDAAVGTHPEMADLIADIVNPLNHCGTDPRTEVA